MFIDANNRFIKVVIVFKIFNLYYQWNNINYDICLAEIVK